jgi:uncharacterized membrane protein YjgN (DUF898 family)
MSEQPASAPLPPPELPGAGSAPSVSAAGHPSGHEAGRPRPGPIGTPADFLRTIQQSLQPGPPAPPASLPLPGIDDTPADLQRTLEESLRTQSAPAAESPTPPLLGTEKKRELHAFVFHGEEREYFRIWIVNTLLTLLTGGLFAPWAKVRKRRYLRGNTELMGHRFDYRADPRRILTGTLVVAVLFLGYMVIGEVYPVVRFGTLGLGVLLLPWIVVRSLAFNAHNTAYRGLRFQFRQTYGMAALTYLGQALVVGITLGIYYPAWIRNQREFSIGSHRLGDAFFRFTAKSGPFYAAYLVAGAMVFGAAMIGGGMTGVLLAVNKHKVATLVELVPFFIVYGFVLYLAKQYLFARLFNHVWNHTRLDEHRFSANLGTGAWLKLQLHNLGLLLVSGGLLYPWTVVRSTRYALSCLHFEPVGPLDRIERLGKDEGSAFGETAGEFIGMDFGL